jgi:hypothetical protein
VSAVAEFWTRADLKQYLRETIARESMMTGKKPKLCMFCGADQSLGPMNKEHFVPRCLWSGQLPKFMKTCPAHVRCNSGFSSDEAYFRDLLVIDAAAGDHPEVKKLQAKIYRKLRKRPGEMSEIFKGAAVRPLHTESGLFIGRRPTIVVDYKRLDRVLAKVMKGMFYTIKGYPLPQGHRIGVHPMNSRVSSRPDVLQLVGSLGSVNSFGDDVFYCRTATDRTEGDRFIGLMQFYCCQTFLGLAYPPCDTSLESSARELAP